MNKIIPSQPLLITLYGYPGAGKTYFGRQLCEHFQAAHVQSERIRAELFDQPRYDREENAVVGQLTDYMAEEFLRAGLSVVYDAPAFRQSQRREISAIGLRHHARPLVIWFQIDAESAFVRASKRDRRKLDDRYSAPVDRATFDHYASGMQNPRGNEEYIVVSGKHVFATQLSAMVKRLHELGIIQANEAIAKTVKPELVNLVPNPMASGRVDYSRRNIIIR